MGTSPIFKNKFQLTFGYVHLNKCPNHLRRFASHLDKRPNDLDTLLSELRKWPNHLWKFANDLARWLSDLTKLIRRLRQKENNFGSFAEWVGNSGLIFLILINYTSKQIRRYRDEKWCISVSGLYGLAVVLFKNRLTFRFNLLDGVIIVRLLWMVPLKFLFDRYANLFENADILASLMLFYFLVQIMVSDRTEAEIARFLKQVFVVLAIVCSMEVIYGLMQYCGLDLFHPGGYPSYESKVVGTFGSANSMGCFLAVLTPILLYLFGIQKTKILKILSGLGIGITLIALVLTLSRGAWAALIGGLIFLVYPSSAKFVKKRVSGRRKWESSPLLF